MVILDEAVSALDVSTQNQIINLLEDLQANLGVSFVFIAHDLAVVRHIARRTVVMYLGKVMEEGPSERLFTAPAHPCTEALLPAVPEPNPQHEIRRIESCWLVNRQTPPSCLLGVRSPPGAVTRWRSAMPRCLRPLPLTAAVRLPVTFRLTAWNYVAAHCPKPALADQLVTDQRSPAAAGSKRMGACVEALTRS